MNFIVLFLCQIILLTQFVDSENTAYIYNRECKQSTRGGDYTGARNVTASGMACQAWSSQYPQKHTSTDPRYFPDSTMQDVSNYCRNPANSQGVEPWCYTTDPDVRWQYCDIEDCSPFAECKLYQNGSDYLGHTNVDANGVECKPWADTEFPGEENYCRNQVEMSGDGMPDGPYCVNINNELSYCDVTYCKPSANCLTVADGSYGGSYVGSVAVTANGRLCQRWDSQTPHTHPFTDPAYFPDDSISDAGNMCRNPDGDADGPWCYTLDASTVRESCGIPVCRDCISSFEGQEYAGTRSRTVSGKTCLHWFNMTNYEDIRDPDRFPDASLVDASNYCRNPDRDSGGPWCFVGDTNTAADRETCRVPQCHDDSASSPFQKRLTRHVVHIGIDGLKPCFVNASSGAPNILQRVGDAGASTLSMGRSVLTTVSAPNWLAATCAMSPESSGTTDNSWQPPWLGFPQDITPISGDDMPFSCIWKEIKSQDRNIRTATFTDWDWWNYITSIGLPKAIDYDYYCDIKENGENYTLCDEKSVDNLLDYLDAVLPLPQTTYTFIYFSDVDETGHRYGWCRNQYFNAVNTVDEQVGQILDVVDRYDVGETSVYINTDHGGHGFSHGSYADSDIIIPMFMRGPGIKQGYQFQHEVRNTDITPTIMHLLGLRKNLWWDGKIIEEAFTDSNI